mgnify:CR=1 FL=1
MKKLTPAPALATLIAAATLGGTSLSAAAQSETIDLYPGSGDLFQYADFAPKGVVTETEDSFILAVDEDSDGGSGLFGILGRNVADGPVEFDAASHLLRIEYRFTEANEADLFKLVLTDEDGKKAGEQFKFDVEVEDDDAVQGDDGFMVLNLPITADDADSITGGKDAGFKEEGDGEANFGLTQWQLQSAWGSSDPLHVEVRSLQIVPAEPE